MKIIYDREVDALSIKFRDTTVTVKNLTEGISAESWEIGSITSTLMTACGSGRATTRKRRTKTVSTSFLR